MLRVGRYRCKGNFMAFCVMIRNEGEDPLSPALRDIQRERERERERGQNCTRDTVVTPSLSGMLV